MISTGVALHHGGAPEFSGPEHKCGVEQSALIKIVQQRGNRLISLGGIADVVVGVVVVAVPAEFIDGVVDLYEANTFFDQST